MRSVVGKEVPVCFPEDFGSTPTCLTSTIGTCREFLDSRSLSIPSYDWLTPSIRREAYLILPNEKECKSKGSVGRLETWGDTSSSRLAPRDREAQRIPVSRNSIGHAGRRVL